MMTDNHTLHTQQTLSAPRHLWFFVLSYSMAIALANWFNMRLIHVAGLDTDAGILIFPFTFLLSDLITEVYGFKHARRAIWCGFLFNVIFIVYGQVIIHLPSPAYATNNVLFDTLFAGNMRIIAASFLSYLIAEPLNAWMLAKLKLKWQGRLLSIRFVTSTLIAALIDSFLFSFIAFSSLYPPSALLTLSFNMWLIKVAVEIVGLPLSIYLAARLKKTEQWDIYDEMTRFNFFSLDTHYTGEENKILAQSR